MAAREGCGSDHGQGHQGRKVRSGYLPFGMKMRVRNRSRQNDRLRGMLVQVHIDISPLHTPLPVFRRIGERTNHIRGENMAAREGCVSDHGQGHQGRKVRSGYLPFGMKMRVRNRSRQNDRLRGMLVQVHIDISPLHTPLPVFRRIGERTNHIRGENGVYTSCELLVESENLNFEFVPLDDETDEDEDNNINGSSKG
ncbi:uncharacterized protein TNCV_1800451 [Trichonephila clavipes]|nr:uncharacterized protein TNCV_1800451 [Trichonephila clavipes]